MADVETRAGGIGKHVETIEFGLRLVVQGTERPMLFPVGLPFGLNRTVIEGFAHKTVPM
jgi:hypothetical protein